MRWLVAASVVPALTIAFEMSAAAQPAIDVDVERYRQAAGSATVVTRVYQEGRRSSAADAPLADTTLLLLPRSERLLARLGGIKAAARDSLSRYRGAVAELRRAQDEFIKAIGDAGGEALIRRGTTDAAGAGALTDVPPGDWILLAWRAEMVDKPSSHAGQREQRVFSEPRPMSGYREIRVWMREVTVERGGREAIELTDRNVWFSGIEEIARTGTGR